MQEALLDFQLPRDHLALELAGALAELEHLTVAVEALHGGFQNEPRGAVVVGGSLGVRVQASVAKSLGIEASWLLARPRSSSIAGTGPVLSE